ncbi:uncharacterized protein LOC141665069 [Apium graveolens]|uniref:uncharacterized protein LOC141665069 n=1 Tax=Apium graveolens TaxID=4045 RepID=UPI003D7BAA11
MVRDRSRVKCFNCHNHGHFATKYCKPRRDREQRVKADSTQINNDEPALLMAEFENSGDGKIILCNGGSSTDKLVVMSNEDNTWYLDNNSSNHMTRHHEKFKNLNESITCQVKFRDRSLVHIKGKGSVKMVCRNGEEHELKEVYYTNSSKQHKEVYYTNSSKLLEEGNRVVLDGDMLWVYAANRKLLIKLQKASNRLYKMCIKGARGKCLLTKIEEETELQGNRTLTKKEVDLLVGNGAKGLVDTSRFEKTLTALHLREARERARKEAAKSASTGSGYRWMIGHSCGYLGEQIFERRVAVSVHQDLYVTYIKIPNVHVRKLDDISKKGVHLGRELGTKAYRLFDPSTGEAHVSRDVYFEEARSWQWNSTELNIVELGNFTAVGNVADEQENVESKHTFISSEDHIFSTPQSNRSNINQSSSVNLVTSIIGVSHPGTEIGAETNEGSGSEITSEPRRFRALRDIYDQTEKIELAKEFLFLGIDKPVAYEKAIKNRVWKVSMQNELDAIVKNYTRLLTDLPNGHKAVYLKWVFKVEKNQMVRLSSTKPD